MQISSADLGTSLRRFLGVLCVTFAIVIAGWTGPAGAAITRPANGFVTSTTSGAAVSNITLTQPTGAITGDFLIAQIAVRGGATITPPTGWTTIVVRTVGTTITQGVYYHVVTATDPPSGGYLFTFNSSQRAGGGITTYRGVDTSSPIDGSSAATNTSGSTIAAPAVTTVSANAQVLAFFGTAHATSVSSVDYATVGKPITYNEVYDVPTGAGPNGVDIQIAEITPVQAAVGSTDSIVATSADAAAHIGVIVTLRELPSSLDHFRLSHAGSGVNCLAENVTFSAHNNAHVATAMTAGTVINITTSTNHGDWSLVTGSGALVNSGNGAATYTSGVESSFVLALRDTFAETVNINVVSGAVTEASGTAAAESSPGTDPNLVFSASGFRFVDGSGGVIATQVAGKPSVSYNLQAINSTGCSTPGACTGVCTGLFASGASVSIQLASECMNPTACQAGQQVNITNNVVSGNIQSNNSGAAISYTSRSLLFGANSQAAFTMTYPDAGQIRLHARYALDASNSVTGSSNSFVVRPFGFYIDVPGNPAATDETGAVFKKAGESFSATVTAVAWQAADDSNNDGIPDAGSDLSNNSATPNFNKESTPETVTLSNTLVAPAGGASGSVSGGSGVSGFSNGSKSVTLSFSEVGIITLAAGLSDANYLTSGQNVIGTTGNVGRFIPDHFALTSGTLANRNDFASCADTFTYMDEPFLLNYVVRAESASNGLTQNYTGTFAKLNLTSSAAMGYGAVNGTTNLTGRLAATAAASGSWLNGVGTVAAPFTMSRAATPDGPYASINIGIAPNDSDTVQLSASALNIDVDSNASNDHARIGITAARFGRLRLSNAYGSELLDMPVRMSLQYWSGVGFIEMGTTDSCTTFAASDMALVFPVAATNRLAACETRVSLVGGVPAALKLTKPGAGNDGWATVRMNLGTVASGSTCVGASATSATTANKAYLRGNWGGGAYDKDPTALVRFGAYRSGDGVIYSRELY